MDGLPLLELVPPHLRLLVLVLLVVVVVNPGATTRRRPPAAALLADPCRGVVGAYELVDLKRVESKGPLMTKA